MSEQPVDFEKRPLAMAVFELRVLLSSHLDPNENSQAATAAQVAYCLHNQALAALSGQSFDVAQALDSLNRLEPQLGHAYLQQFRKAVLNVA
nr:putative integron gene cassette protein [uncultured bacterium]